MSRKQSKRKLPEREVKLLKEKEKIEDYVFDRATTHALGNLIKKGYFHKLDYPIATGKEAYVFRASGPRGYVAVKIYKIETAAFNEMRRYIEMDPHLKKLVKNRRKLLYAWASKEFRNLQAIDALGIRVPKPIVHAKNVLVMEFIGEGNLPFPMLKDANFGEECMALEFYEVILHYIRKMYLNGIVHADLSEYNVLATHDGPVLIDVGQSFIDHPQAQDFLKKDVENTVGFFKSKYKLKINMESAINYALGKE